LSGNFDKRIDSALEADASRALSELNGKQLLGRKVAIVHAKRRTRSDEASKQESTTETAPKSKKQRTGSNYPNFPSPSNATRLIVRNLSFQVISEANNFYVCVSVPMLTFGMCFLPLEQ
jgi:RNA recognition motif-containing protein